MQGWRTDGGTPFRAYSDPRGTLEHSFLSVRQRSQSHLNLRTETGQLIPGHLTSTFSHWFRYKPVTLPNKSLFSVGQGSGKRWPGTILAVLGLVPGVPWRDGR